MRSWVSLIVLCSWHFGTTFLFSQDAQTEVTTLTNGAQQTISQRQSSNDGEAIVFDEELTDEAAAAREEYEARIKLPYEQERQRLESKHGIHSQVRNDTHRNFSFRNHLSKTEPSRMR